VFESGAVLWYLANQTDKLILEGATGRYAVLEWLFWGAGGPGPMIGQAGYWTTFAKEKNPAAIERYTTETQRLMKVADTRLGANKYLAGDTYTIADIMSFTWLRAPGVRFGFDMAPYPHLAKWIAEIEARPAVARALAMKPA
jgi:GST-like protein